MYVDGKTHKKVSNENLVDALEEKIRAQLKLGLDNL
jgi:hypothetical protein